MKLNTKIIGSEIIYGTGLTDKYQREIFEGDILAVLNKKGSPSTHQCIMWDKKSAGFRMSCGQKIHRTNYLQIVGNIFETKFEMLTSGRIKL